MDNQSIELVNKLILHVRRSGNAQPLCFGEKSKALWRAARHRSSFEGGSAHAPPLQFARIYRPGLLELVWPRLDLFLDAEIVLKRSLWIACIAGALSVWLYSGQPITAAALGAFLITAGLGVHRGSFFAAAGLFVLLSAFILRQLLLHSPDPSISTFLFAITLFCMAGGARTSWAVSHGKFGPPREAIARRRSGWSNTLLVLLGLAAFGSISGGSIVRPEDVRSNDWMEPTLSAHDGVVAIPVNWFGGPRRGDVVTYWEPSGQVFVARIVGVPGDAIQVKSGRLIRNGRTVDEPYCRIVHSEPLDDFPPSPQAFRSDVYGELQKESYGTTLVAGKPFRVAAGTYFVLNDNRNAIYDSRLTGPIQRESVAGRVILAYHAGDRGWLHPHLIR